MRDRSLWRHRLVGLAREGELSAAGLELALRRLALLPTPADWRRLADRLLLAAGLVLLLAGVLFFFAFNWSALHRYARLALAAAPLCVAALAALWCGRRYERHPRPEGLRRLQAALGTAVVLIGVLLAVIGQIYQTGADSELLFAGWALLALPWVLVAAAPWLWLFWLLVVNVAVLLFLAGRADLWAALVLPVGSLWSPLWLNLAVLGVWEGLAAWRGVARPDYAPRCVAVLTAIAATAFALAWVFRSTGDGWPGQDWAPVFYAGWAVALSLYYRHFRRDLVPLALVAGSLVIVGSAGFGRQIFVVQRFDVSGFLLLGAIVAGLSAAATVWLRHTARRWQAHAESQVKGEAKDGAKDEAKGGTA